LVICDKLKSLEVPVHYLPYGVPMPQHIVREARTADAPLRILYLGRLCKEQKRVHLFPELQERLRASEIPFEWTIAGTGEMEATLRREMQSHSRDQSVRFLGAVQYRDVPKLLLEHDIYLLMSDYEGLPLSLLEAMGSGLVPVVSALSSGIPDVVDSDSGIMIPINDISAFAKAITSLHSDRPRLEAMSQKARASALGQFSVEAMGKRWLSMPIGKSILGGLWTIQNIRPPLTAKHPFYFSRAFRGLRRLVKKLP
jgi:glycosyltransferase involved in cell wall biosynthesis